jgi:hypothetical protein
MRTITLSIVPLLLFAQKPVPQGAGADSKVAIEAKIYMDPESVKSVLGVDPGPGIMVVELTLTPKGKDKVRLDRDHFLLRSDRDGQSGRPMEPTQIAGSSVLVVGSKGGTQGTTMSEQRRVPYGVPGVPGGGPMGGPPPTLPGMQPPVVGGATANTSDATASIEEREAKDNPVLAALKQKLLPDGEIEKPVSGLLYFNIEGRHRVRQMELVYRRSPPRVHVRFIEPGKKQ